VRHVVEWNYGGQRFAWLRIAEKRQLRSARRRAQVKTDFITLPRGYRNAEGADLPRSHIWRNFD